MKGTQKIAQSNSGTRGKQNKPSKRNKGNKNPKDAEAPKHQEKGAVVKSKPAKKNRGGKKTNDADSSSDQETIDNNNGMNTKQAEKRKQDGTEWKALKKIDYQRLETVVEEGQLSNEETALKPHCPEDSNNIDGKCIKQNTTQIPVAEKQELKTQNEVQEEISNKTVPVEDKESCGEPDCKISQPRRNVNLNGMMEILPIFSNDKFVCSRDAISIEECEDLEALEKNKSGELMRVMYRQQNSTALILNFIVQANSVKKEAPPVQELEERVMEKLAEPREFSERKLRYKMLTDINLTQRSSSHFINSLLVLTPFAADRDPLTVLDNVRESVQKENFPVQGIETPEDITCELKTVPIMVLTTLGLFLLCLALAWKTYEPPRLIDYILEFIPFIHRRRTFVQLFFDRVIRIISNVFSGSCKNF